MRQTTCWWWIGLCLLAGTLVVSRPAAAQSAVTITYDNSPPPVYTPRPRRVLPRIRIEAGIEFGFFFQLGNFPVHQTDDLGFGTGGGLHLRVGVQFKEWLAAQLEGSFGVFVASGYARGAATVNFTPAHWFSASLGPVFGTFSNIGGTVEYVGVTLRPDFHVYQYRAKDRQRHSFTIGLSAEFGRSLQGRDPARNIAGGMLNFGYTMH